MGLGVAPLQMLERGDSSPAWSRDAHSPKKLVDLIVLLVPLRTLQHGAIYRSTARSISIVVDLHWSSLTGTNYVKKSRT